MTAKIISQIKKTCISYIKHTPHITKSINEPQSVWETDQL